MANQVQVKHFWQKQLQTKQVRPSFELLDQNLSKNIQARVLNLYEKFSEQQKKWPQLLSLLMKLMQSAQRDITHHPVASKRFNVLCLSCLLNLMVLTPVAM